MKLDQVKRGQNVTVKEHEVTASNWAGTQEHPATSMIKEYRGAVEEIYQDGAVVIVRDGTREVREEVDPEFLSPA